jgi:hypothetical protein
VNELRVYPYPLFEFIVAGLDSQTQAHIFTVDQDGNVKSWDFLGFTTIGSGSELAFSEMTKWYYEITQPLTLAIPRIYFAKKAAERAQGVGHYTDFGFIGYVQTTDNQIEPNPFLISGDPRIIKLLEEAHGSIGKNEADTINKTMQTIEGMFKVRYAELRQAGLINGLHSFRMPK